MIVPYMIICNKKWTWIQLTLANFASLHIGAASYIFYNVFYHLPS